MVAGKQHHRQACASNDAAGTVEETGRYAVAIERVARKQNHIGPVPLCRAQDRRQASIGITIMRAAHVVMLNVQIGAVNYDQFTV
jgi:hypothetical protein